MSPDDACVEQDPGGEQEGKQQLVSLEQAAAHVQVQREREVLDDRLHALQDVFCRGVGEELVIGGVGANYDNDQLSVYTDLYP